MEVLLSRDQTPPRKLKKNLPRQILYTPLDFNQLIFTDKFIRNIHNFF